MTSYFTFDFGPKTGTRWGYPSTPPDPQKVVEVTFEHPPGARHKVLMTGAALAEWLAKSAHYEADLAARARSRAQQPTERPLSVQGAQRTIRVLSQTAEDVPLRTAVLRAKRIHHPDTGGTAKGFQMVLEAEEILERAGLLKKETA